MRTDGYRYRSDEVSTWTDLDAPTTTAAAEPSPCTRFGWLPPPVSLMGSDRLRGGLLEWYNRLSKYDGTMGRLIIL